jgi:hypothetical protein
MAAVAAELTRCGTQPVEPVGPKGCLHWIILWRSNRLPKWSGMGMKDSYVERKLWRRIWAAGV